MITLFSNFLKCDVAILDSQFGSVVDIHIEPSLGQTRAISISTSKYQVASTYLVDVQRCSYPGRHGMIEVDLNACDIKGKREEEKCKVNSSCVQGGSLTQSTIFLNFHPIAQIVDLIIDTQSWLLLHLVMSTSMKKTIIVPFKLVEDVESANVLLTPSLNDEILNSSPAFNPHTFGDWEHKMLMQYYKAAKF